MNCQNSSHEFPRAVVAALLLIGAAVGGCVHRPYIQQGNYLETTDVDQVTSGMTRSQVRYLLGTPMIADSFHRDRWDYAYYFRRGRSPDAERRWVIVHFENDRVARIDRDLELEPAPN